MKNLLIISVLMLITVGLFSAGNGTSLYYTEDNIMYRLTKMPSPESFSSMTNMGYITNMYQPKVIQTYKKRKKEKKVPVEHLFGGTLGYPQIKAKNLEANPSADYYEAIEIRLFKSPSPEAGYSVVGLGTISEIYKRKPESKGTLPNKSLSNAPKEHLFGGGVGYPIDKSNTGLY